MKTICWLLLLLTPFSLCAQKLTSVGGTASSGSSGICIGSGFKEVSKLTNNITTDKATITMLAGLGCKSWVHTSLNGTGVSGTYAGFHVASGSLANLLNTVEVHTFLNGAWQEGASGSGLLSIIVSAEGDLYFKTNKPYNEVRLVFNSLLSVAYGAEVYYAFGQTTRPDLDVLPVAVYQFKATLDGGKAKLHWQFEVTDTKDVMYVEKSRDGIHFTTIAALQYNGTHHFNFDDLVASGIAYYRIKAASGNAVHYSSVQVVHNAHHQQGIRVQTQVHDALELWCAAAGVYNLRLYNGSGQQMFAAKQNIMGYCRIALPRHQLKNGVYVLQMIDENGHSATCKVVLAAH